MVETNAMVKVKRIYDPAEKNDGFRVLVDRLWPRGVSKERAHLDLWLKEIAPSDALRKWFGHDPKRWVEFKSRYRKELSGKKDFVLQLRKLVAEHKSVTLLYAAHDQLHNEAVALLSLIKPARTS